MKLLIGCDPEIALRNKSGKFVSAEGIVPGDKLNPYPVKKGTVQVDGFAAEIGIDPATEAEEFADNVSTVLEELKKFTGDLEFVYTDHVIFDDDVYLSVTDKCRELGCTPDFNAYTRVHNPIPVPNPKGLRTFSGHIHIGWCESEDVTSAGHFADCVSVTKQMDWFLGAPSLAWGSGAIRRRLYGAAGAFRVKSYGCEYRTPDNSWLVSRDRMKFMFEGAVEGMARLYKGEHVYNKYQSHEYINRGDFESSKKFLRTLGIKYPGSELDQDKKAKNPYIKYA